MTATEIADIIKDIVLGVTPILTILINNIYNSKKDSLNIEQSNNIVEREQAHKIELLKEEDKKLRREHVYNQLVIIYDSIARIDIEYCFHKNISTREEINDEYKRIFDYSNKAREIYKKYERYFQRNEELKNMCNQLNHKLNEIHSKVVNEEDEYEQINETHIEPFIDFVQYEFLEEIESKLQQRIFEINNNV